MRSFSGIRSLAPIAAVCLFVGLTPTVALADDPPPPPTAVTINDGNDWTSNPIVAVLLPFPTDSAGLVRLSNNGADWSSPQGWQSALPWDVTDPSTGGYSLDGYRTVYVQTSDGSGWTDAGSDYVWLDRVAPTTSGGYLLCQYTSGWIVQRPCWGSIYDNGLEPYSINLDALEFSLDGGPWTNMLEVPGDGFDFRTPMWGGTYENQDRQLCLRAHDRAGNLGGPSCATYDLNIPPTVPRPDGTLYDVRLEMPLPAITGQPFTLRPVFPDDFPDMPRTALCEWILTWGDMDPTTHYILVNENFGSVWMTHLYRKGGCGEWTFTLPYTPGLTYKYDFRIHGRWSSDIYAYLGGHTGTTFRATVGTTERGIPHSTLGLAYILPDQTETRPGEPATYHLYKSDTPDWSLPAGYWWAYNLQDCGSNFGDNNPTLLKTYTYTPDCQASWRTGWTWEDWDTHEYLRAEYDPPADKAPPKVAAPQATGVVGGQLAATLPTTISWTATDPIVRTVSTGVVRNKLQMSRNGGAWKTVTLSSPSATSIVLNLLPAGSYRFRARAWDRVGNRSAWSTGPVLKPRLLEQSQATVNGGWATISSLTLSGGTALRTGAPGAWVSLSLTGRGVNWVGSRGPDHGLAQITIDGVLVQTIDLNSPTATDRSVLFTRAWTAAGTHTLRVICLGTFGRPVVTVDAFTVY